MKDNPLRKLPPVHEVLNTPLLAALAEQHPRSLILQSIRGELSRLRAQLRNGGVRDGVPDAQVLADRVARQLAQTLRPGLRRVINGTGIVLHTNLGRAPLAEEAALAAAEAGRGYLNLEMDLGTGKRSNRQHVIRDALVQLTGAEAATAVNNNAAATVICLRALAQGKEVILSRGQLIEIGGSFRIPEIMAVSGATLREVGTTNITRLADYERAIGPNTGALLRIHTSNYRVRGFTKSVPLKELVKLAHRHDLPVIDDTGSGAMVDFGRFGFLGEPVVRSSIAAGADLVLFSGDKLLGGPQAGLIVGRKTWVQKIEKDPLMRAFRLDKMTLAALESTLHLYLDEERALREIPVLRLLGTPLSELHHRAEHLAAQLEQIDALAFVQVCDDRAYVGGGSLPDQAMPTVVLEIQARNLPDQELAQRLRTGEPAVLGRLRDGKLVLDVRTIFPHQEAALIEALRRAVE